MAGGWSKDGAVQQQIDASTEDAVEHARQQLPSGESLLFCQECSEDIPQARRQAFKGVRLCINCQSMLEAEEASFSLYNRRTSKDSQLR